MPPPAVVAAASRGEVREALYRGHVVVADADGGVLGSAGDPDVVTPLRSCAKPLQALPFVASAMDRLGATPEELALACASHNGEDEHVATARALLARAGVSEADLACGPQLPGYEPAARRLLATGGAPLPVHNNCSGKHAAMLATCVAAGWPLVAYTEPAHPMQQAVTAALSRFCGFDLTEAPRGVDGCGLPTFGVPLRLLARAFAAAQAASPEFRRCQEAMAARPFHVAGTGRFDTALLEAFGAGVTAKIGGAGVWVAVLRPAGPAVAVKLEAGSGEAIPPVALAVLRLLGAVSGTLPEPLAAHAEPVLRNWAGTAVGRIRPLLETL